MLTLWQECSMNLLLVLLLGGLPSWLWHGPKMTVDICPGWTLEQSKHEADVIFTGIVLNVQTGEPRVLDENGQERIIVKFQNQRYWQWKKNRENRDVPPVVFLYTRTYSPKSLEGFNPAVGQEYLIFSPLRRSYFWTTREDIKQAKRSGVPIQKEMLFYDQCFPSGLTSAKEAVIKQLGPGSSIIIMQ
jgi:hypothetical protein